MTIWYKQGVYGELQPEAAEGLRKVERLYAVEYGQDVYVTSIRDGAHGPGSFHPWGRAWDQRLTQKPIPRRAVMDKLGNDFDVVDHGTPKHRHIEYDPK